MKSFSSHTTVASPKVTEGSTEDSVSQRCCAIEDKQFDLAGCHGLKEQFFIDGYT